MCLRGNFILQTRCLLHSTKVTFKEVEGFLWRTLGFAHASVSTFLELHLGKFLGASFRSCRELHLQYWRLGGVAEMVYEINVVSSIEGWCSFARQRYKTCTFERVPPPPPPPHPPTHTHTHTHFWLNWGRMSTHLWSSLVPHVKQKQSTFVKFWEALRISKVRKFACRKSLSVLLVVMKGAPPMETLLRDYSIWKRMFHGCECSLPVPPFLKHTFIHVLMFTICVDQTYLLIPCSGLKYEIRAVVGNVRTCVICSCKVCCLNCSSGMLSRCHIVPEVWRTCEAINRHRNCIVHVCTCT